MTHGYAIPRAMVACALIGVLGVSGCSTLPKPGPEVAQYANQVDTSDTTLSKLLRRLSSRIQI